MTHSEIMESAGKAAAEMAKGFRVAGGSECGHCGGSGVVPTQASHATCGRCWFGRVGVEGVKAAAAEALLGALRILWGGARDALKAAEVEVSASTDAAQSRRARTAVADYTAKMSRFAARAAEVKAGTRVNAVAVAEMRLGRVN